MVTSGFGVPAAQFELGEGCDVGGEEVGPGREELARLGRLCDWLMRPGLGAGRLWPPASSGALGSIWPPTKLCPVERV